MRKFFLGLSLVLLLTGVYSARKNFAAHSQVTIEESSSEVLSVTQEPSSATPEPTDEPATTQPPTATPIYQDQTSQSLSSYFYPGARTIQSSGNTMVLESSDTPEAVTNWYKEKIVSGGYNVKTFVQTKTNGKVLNKLVGAKTGEEIRVDITNDNENSDVKVTVNIIL